MSITIAPLILTKFFIAVLLLVLFAHLFGFIFSKLKMPNVVGEIFGGLLLGPTFFGYIAPELYQDIFLAQGELLATIYWLGLVLLMFSSGFEIERKFEKRDEKVIIALVIGTTVIPLSFGWISTYFFDLEKMIGPENNILSLKLVITVALAITSIPVISKIFLDLGIMQTAFAKITLAIATIHDIILWVFVSMAIGLVSNQTLSLANMSLHLMISMLFFIIALIAIPKAIKLLDGRKKGYLVPEGTETPFIALILLSFIVLASLLGVNLVFGAFLAGIVVNYIKTPRFQDSKVHIKRFSMALFIPVYFAVVGIKLDLIHHVDWMFFIIFSIFAIIVQTIAVLSTARFLRFNWLSSINLAVVLNDRGGPCIVLATLAFDLGIISENFFVTLVLLAITTSLTAGAWLKYVLSKGWDLLKEDN
jgi:Kef-type K+ transport system membrane component KefB